MIASTNSHAVVSPGQIYYLALQNTNSVAVTNFAVEVDFHLVQPPPAPVRLQFSRAVVAGSGVQLQWIASAGAQVQVQWTTNLTSPGSWNTITNPATTTSNGVTTFTDDGEQTAPLGAQRFYRLVQMPQSP